MTLEVVPGFIGESGYSHPVELFRNLVKGLTAEGKGYLRSSSDFALTPSGASLTLAVAPGWAAIKGTEAARQGSYFAWNSASENIAWPGASGQPRIDSLLLRVIDKQYGTDADANGAQWQIHQGTPAASPSAIADSEFEIGGSLHRPGAWWRVCNVLISPGNTLMTSTTITDLRTWADSYRTSLDALNSYKTNTLDSTWTAYTPVFSAGGGSPAIGSGGVIKGWYKQIGKTVHYTVYCLFGTSPNFGTGALAISLPSTSRNVTDGGWLGTAYLRDTSATSSGHFTGISFVNPNDNKVQFFSNPSQVTNAFPFAWTSTDFLRASGSYEAA